MSEIAKHRHLLLPYCQGNGIDIGSGGDPITPNAISIDLKKSYTSVGNSPIHLRGDARNLYWFRNNVLDYIVSSHLIEDFDNIRDVLLEWLRVLKPGGHLCLLFPDEMRYRSIEKRENWNLAHKHINMGLDYMLEIVNTIPYTKIIQAQELFDNNDYNCMIIIKKRHLFPHDYSWGQIYGKEQQILHDALLSIATTNNILTIIDLGCADLNTGKAMISICESIGARVKYFGIDHIAPEQADWPNMITIREDVCNPIVLQFIPMNFDFILIDACHCFECVTLTISLYLPKVKLGGLAAFHDTGINSDGYPMPNQDRHSDKTLFCSVNQAIEMSEILQKKWIKIAETKERHGMTIFKKIRE